MASWRCAPTWGCESLLDAAAKAAYQARLPELRAELEEAEGFNDPARATRARHELDSWWPSLGRPLASTIQTGRSCSYTPIRVSRSPGSADPAGPPAPERTTVHPE
jgi:hypothetical protein